MSDLIGKTIGQYQIVEQIGLGGMATVYKAYQPSIDRYVAIKILPKQLAYDPNFVKRFQHEAKAIAALEHPHILPIHDFDTEGEYTYLVMRYVEGGTLTNLMGQSLPYERIIQIVGNIARALDYAHRQGVVHRDIKPSNILIDKHGEELLTDFGIAKMVEGSSDTQLTSAGSILGTPAYMSPEQAEGKAVDGRSDIYSLGVVLYELLTGQPPYRAETPLAIVLMHLNEPLLPPRTIKPGIPEPLERVVLKAMAKKPDDRFQSAADMEKALKQALREIESSPGTADLPLPSSRTRTEPAPQLVSPPPPAKSGGIMAPLLIVGGLVVLLLCVAGAGVIAWAVMGTPTNRATGTAVASSQVQANLPTATPKPTTPTTSATPTTPPTPTIPATAEPASTATASPSATPVTTPASGDTALYPSDQAGEILFAEDFASNDNDWDTGTETDEYGQYQAEIVDGRYRLSHQAEQGTFIWEEPAEADFHDFDDFFVSVNAIPVEYSAPFAYGLVFRSNTDDQQLYAFEIDSDGYFVVNLLQDGEWQTLVEYTEMAAIVSEGPNTLAVEADGTALTFFINGEEVTSIEDDSLQSGSVGVAFELYETGDTATVDFDNLVVQAIEATEPAAEVIESETEVTEPETEAGVIFADYFDSDANGWSTGQFEDDYTEDEITIEDGVYTLSVTAKQKAYVEKVLPSRQFDDFVLTLEATPLDAEEHYSYGVAFRENSDLYTYAFEIGNDGLYSVQLYDGEWKTLKAWSSTDAINVGETNELMVIADGSTLTFFVNGEQLTRLEDDTLAEGTVGLVVDMFEEDTWAGVEFDNLVIQEIEDAE